MTTGSAEKIVSKMMERDRFSQWLGIRVLETGPGFCRIEMTIREEMVNGLGIGHGGIVYAMADSALAFAANSHGNIAVALNNSISYPSAVMPGNRLEAVCTEISRTRRTGTYDVTVKDQEERLVGLFRGMVYRKKEQHADVDG